MGISSEYENVIVAKIVESSCTPFELYIMNFIFDTLAEHIQPGLDANGGTETNKETKTQDGYKWET